MIQNRFAYILIYSLTSLLWNAFYFGRYFAQSYNLSKSIFISFLYLFQGFIISFSFVFLFFAILSLNRKILKFFSILIPFLSSLALYPINHFSLPVNYSFLLSTINTNSNEFNSFIGIKFCTYGLLGFIYSYFIFRYVKFKKYNLKSFANHLQKIIKSIFLLLLINISFAISVAKITKDNNEVKIKNITLNMNDNYFNFIKIKIHNIVPINYLYGILKFKRYFSRERLGKVGKNIQFKKTIWSNKIESPITFIFIIGESARGDHFGINGYPRNTTPNLSKMDNLISFKNVKSCSTSTLFSISCMLSPKKKNEFQFPSKHENLMHLISKAKFNIEWRTSQRGELYSQEIFTQNLHQYEITKDDKLLIDEFEKNISKIISKNNKNFVVLHTYGSHSPYYDRYSRDNFKLFLNDCKEAIDIDKCTKEEIINAYDNTILSTDFAINRVNNIMKKTNSTYMILYVSDHAENLGENGYYTHGGSDGDFGVEYQYKIPMIMIISDKYKKYFNINYTKLQNLAKKEHVSHDNIFHTVMGLLGITSKEYDKSLDLINGY